MRDRGMKYPALRHCPPIVLDALLKLAVRKQEFERMGLQSLADEMQGHIDLILAIGVRV